MCVPICGTVPRALGEQGRMVPVSPRTEGAADFSEGPPAPVALLALQVLCLGPAGGRAFLTDKPVARSGGRLWAELGDRGALWHLGELRAQTEPGWATSLLRSRGPRRSRRVPDG